MKNQKTTKILKALSLGGLLLAGCSGNKDINIKNEIQTDKKNIVDATVIKHYPLFMDGNPCIVFELDTDNNPNTWEHFVTIYSDALGYFQYMQDGANIQIKRTNNVWLKKFDIIGQKQR